MDAADIRHLRDVAAIEKESEDIDIRPLLGPHGSDDEFAKFIAHVVPRSFRICAANRASLPCAQATPTSSRSTRNNCADRSEEHTSELQSLMRTTYAVFCLKKKNKQTRLRIHYKTK